MPRWLSTYTALIVFLWTASNCVAYTEAKYVNGYTGMHVAPMLQLPQGHPEQKEAGAMGLPQGCITYNERYGKAMNFTKRRSRGWNANEQHRASKYAVLMRIHHEMPWPKDLVLNLRALMEEVTEAGMHFYLLYEDSPFEEPQADDTPQKFLSKIPEEFLPVTFLFDSNDVHNMYPLVHKFKAHIRDYLPALYFMHRFQGYQFAWILEYDVRYTGHWGHFLNSVLNLAVSRLQGTEHTFEDQTQVTANLQLPDEGSQTPDLILFGGDMFSDKIHKDGPEPWWPRDMENWNFTTMSLWSVMEMAWSRRLADALHDNSVAGLAGYLEEFIPSTATDRNLDIVSIPVAEFAGPSNHCCTDHARDYYRDWFRSGQCFMHALLHPVKLYSTPHEMATALAKLNEYQHGALVLPAAGGRRNMSMHGSAGISQRKSPREQKAGREREER